jgi:probable F420-dependent oxidoreductase
MNIGKLGVFHFLDTLSAAEMVATARLVEQLGYGALWYPEALGRESMVCAAWLLAHTDKLVVASGIANIYARDAQATAAAHLALNEMSQGRFLLGLGVSHAPLVEGLRGHDASRPLQAMRSYLEKLRQATYRAPQPGQSGELILAALGPKMLELAASQSDGAHPYNVTPEHTQRARHILGPSKKLYVEQKVALVTDPQQARGLARQAMDFYMGLPNYRKNWLSLGFTEDDLAGPSDRFLDAMVAWGEPGQVRGRLEEHYRAGADHVCIQVLGDLEVGLKALAPS